MLRTCWPLHWNATLDWYVRSDPTHCVFAFPCRFCSHPLPCSILKINHYRCIHKTSRTLRYPAPRTRSCQESPRLAVASCPIREALLIEGVLLHFVLVTLFNANMAWLLVVKLVKMLVIQSVAWERGHVTVSLGKFARIAWAALVHVLVPIQILEWYPKGAMEIMHVLLLVLLDLCIKAVWGSMLANSQDPQEKLGRYWTHVLQMRLAPKPEVQSRRSWTPVMHWMHAHSLQQTTAAWVSLPVAATLRPRAEELSPLEATSCFLLG